MHDGKKYEQAIGVLACSYSTHTTQYQNGLVVKEKQRDLQIAESRSFITAAPTLYQYL